MTTSSIRGWPPRPQRYSTLSSSPPPRRESPPPGQPRQPSPPSRNGSSSPPHHDASPSRRPPPRHGDSTSSHESNLAIRARRGSSPRYNPRHIPPLPTMPSPPRPSADQGIAPPTQAPPDEDDSLPAEPLQLNNITARAALRLLTVTIERHVRDGDNALDQSSLMLAAQAKAAAEQAEKESAADAPSPSPPPEDPHRSPGPASPGSHLHDDIPRSHKTPIGSPETHAIDRSAGTPPAPAASPPPLDLDADAREMQRRILARKFVSRVAPPIAPAEYLQRLHRYCPMSTAVYLTAGLYLERLAQGNRRRSSLESDRTDDTATDAQLETDADPILPINSRTVHRLVLGALRVATKALEDLSYPHTRFAKVGGVSDKELTRLEVAILFLAEFRLIVSPTVMLKVAKTMRARALEGIPEDCDEAIAT